MAPTTEERDLRHHRATESGGAVITAHLAAAKQSASGVQPLRPYQQKAIADTHSAWQNGLRRVCLVAPTGAGKTRLAEELVFHARAANEQVLFVAHRRELIRQAADRLRARFRHTDVGIIAAGEDSDPYAPIQVCSVQTWLARKTEFNASLIIFDEAHHYAAEDWRKLADAYPLSRSVGLTATPKRADGKPLGDMFDALVVAAQYSELLRDGFLVPCAVYQPPQTLQGDLAQDPLIAWQRYAEGSQTFAFCSSVEEAYKLAERFRDAGIPAACVEAKTKKHDRDQILADFASGKLTVVTNVYALTEGVDVPQARTVLLARTCDNVGGYLQICGRVLRPFKGKPHAILIDLTGATLLHGFPTEDRLYTLEGEGIKRTSPGPLRQCPECGATIPGRPEACTECGFVFPVEKVKAPRIYDMELKAVFAGASTPVDAKQRELARLLKLAKEKGWDLYFVQKEFKKLFGELPVLTGVSEDEKREQYAKWQKLAQAKGWKPGFAKFRFKEMFGHWPHI